MADKLHMHIMQINCAALKWNQMTGIDFIFDVSLVNEKIIQFLLFFIITGRNEVVAKVIFLHLFVILFTGGRGGSASMHAGIPPPWDQADPPDQTPPRSDTTPRDQADPPGSDTTPRIRHHPPRSDTTTPQIRHHHPPPRTRQNPPRSDTTPWDQADPPGPVRPQRIRHHPLGPGRPPQIRNHHPPGPGRRPPRPGRPLPPGSRLQHTVYERPVRILLECILVCFASTNITQ